MGKDYYGFYTLSQPTAKVLHFLAFPSQAHPTKHLSEQWQFSDRNGPNTIHFGAVHTYMAYIREYPLPPPPNMLETNIGQLGGKGY